MDVDEEEEADDADDGDNDDDDAEGDNDNDNDDDDQDQDQDQDQDEAESPSQRPRNSIPNGGTPGQADGNPAVTLTSPSPRAAASGVLGNLPFHPSVRQEALNAPVYEIIPTIAAPHSTSINSITATPDMRWVFSGGADGYIRKFNWVDSANGKLALTRRTAASFRRLGNKGGCTSVLLGERRQRRGRELVSCILACSTSPSVMAPVGSGFGRHKSAVGAPSRRDEDTYAQESHLSRVGPDIVAGRDFSIEWQLGQDYQRLGPKHRAGQAQV
jgi:hypothetical protein